MWDNNMYEDKLISLFIHFYQILYCLKRKGLNSSGSQKHPFNIKFITRFLDLPKMLAFLLPNTA